MQLDASLRTYPPVPDVCVVTGGTGFVGARLVEMLVERGARVVRCLDIVPPPPTAWKDPRIEYVVGDICDEDVMDRIVEGAGCVWHNAAAVGPFHPRPLYFRVNYEGTLNVIRACRAKGVRKIVMSSSPSTRFDGSDVDGLTEEQMPSLPQKRYLQTYAETKAMGELALTQACCDDLMTCAVAPHQVYGPRDNLFLPNLLEAAGTRRLRIFGPGTNRICFTHIDNYAHGLIIAERALRKRSPALGKFYIVTDGETHPHKEGHPILRSYLLDLPYSRTRSYVLTCPYLLRTCSHQEGYSIFWKALDEAIVYMGFDSIAAKMHLPMWLLWSVAYVCEAIGAVLGVTLKLNLFNVRTAYFW